jgi:hypothetical protein
MFLSNEELVKLAKEKGWDWISVHQQLSENFIREFQDKVNWDYISVHQKLSENFIREFQDKVNWYWISKYQKLSEDFIREFSNKVDWYWISEYQKLSEDFIREFSNKVDWDQIIKYQALSNNIIQKLFKSSSPTKPVDTKNIDLNEGTKNDQGKIRLDLIPTEFINAVGEILSHGAAKYQDHNWRKGIAYSRVVGALLRHLMAYLAGEKFDKETNKSHLWHAACNLAFLITFDEHPKQYESYNDLYRYDDK